MELSFLPSCLQWPFIFTLFLPETKGLSIEEMDVLFRVFDESTRRHDIEEKISLPTEKLVVIDNPLYNS
ncbi:hypothetical protein LARI1_G007502 [Lachnellula arida]|uniref:Uncharacterized protein n=1 Tax=Lachnellula arida TaxID=1316785 RepID=A0A8T9B1D8_9HELO|nr:hypothetical protein LARI1_G007502 [Lachnellula arida]